MYRAAGVFVLGQIYIRQLHYTRGKTGDVGDASNDGRFGQARGARDHVLVITGRKVRLVLLRDQYDRELPDYMFVIVGRKRAC